MIEQVINSYETISLGKMDSVKLMNRIDTKYILYADLLPLILEQIREYYQVLEMDEKRVFPYRSLYYDTQDNHMYLAHHNGKVNRYKIRFREYVNSGDSFLEIKRKLKGTRTLKHRIQVSGIEEQLSNESAAFIASHTPFNTAELTPRIHTDFSRITLVSKALNERVTIDLGLNFRNLTHTQEAGKLVIIELKRAGLAKHSNLIDALEHYGISPSGFSKYCIGRALIEKQLKSNNFKARILTLNKINDGKYYYRNYN